MSLAQIVNIAQNTPEWLAWRRAGIGGSDAPVVLQESPYKTRRELFFEKRGHPMEIDESNEFIFAKGHRTEKLVRAEFQKLIGEESAPVCLERRDIPFLRVSLDGLSSKRGVLEGKLVGADVLKTALEKAEIPRHHWIQIQHACMVSGADVANWYGHNGMDHGALIEVPADREFIKSLEGKEVMFWEDVTAGRVPALCDRDYLTPTDLTLLDELREAKILADNAKIYFEGLRQKVAEQYKHPKIMGAGVRMYRAERQGALALNDVPEIATAIENARSGLDPVYVESFRKKPSSSWTVTIEKPKKVKVDSGQ